MDQKEKFQEISNRYIPYDEQLKDNRWKKRSAEIQLKDKFHCRICGTDSLSLNVHHLRYINGLKAWEYDDNLLMTVCWSCHEKDIHGIFKCVDYSPCVCSMCGQAIVNKNCNTVDRIGDYYRFDIYCDNCQNKLEVL